MIQQWVVWMPAVELCAVQFEGVWEQGVLGEYLEQREMLWQEADENCMMKSSIVCIPFKILFWWSNQGGWDGQGM
jgi:hypothetical protein